MRDRKKDRKKRKREDEFGNLGLCNRRKKRKEDQFGKAGRGASAIIVYYIQLKAGQMQC